MVRKSIGCYNICEPGTRSVNFRLALPDCPVVNLGLSLDEADDLNDTDAWDDLVPEIIKRWRKRSIWSSQQNNVTAVETWLAVETNQERLYDAWRLNRLTQLQVQRQKIDAEIARLIS